MVILYECVKRGACEKLSFCLAIDHNDLVEAVVLKEIEFSLSGVGGGIAVRSVGQNSEP